jgi:carboxyl-terminal processing protease
LRRGDRILEVDGIAISGKKILDIRALVKGAPGSTLKMKVLRGEQELEFALTREEISLKNVTYKGVIDDGIGYIKLERFNKNAESDIVNAITEIKSKGELKGLIIDLRDNPGGLLDAAIGILNKIIPRGNLLLTTKGRRIDSERKYFSNESPLIAPEIPLAVVVNQNTASASEIVAGAVQDLDRGVVVGTKTFGKGLVQVYTPLSYDNQLKITTQKYFTPSGRWIQSKNYFKENKYGVFKPDPYFSKTDFKTLNGRVVYAEGGITPDTNISYAENNELLEMLINQDMYFKFASKFVSDYPDGSGFIMNDPVADAFYSFLNQEQFEFSPRAETELSHLKKVVEEKNYSERTNTLLAELESELKSERLRDFEKSRPQIKRELEREILRKYNRSIKEITEAGLNDDIQLQTALSIVKDRTLLNRFLK